MTKNVAGDASDYFHGHGNPGSHRYLALPVLALCRRYGGQRVLDIGCGNGALCRELAAIGFSVVGIEPSDSGIRQARKQVPVGRFYQLGVYDDCDLVDEADFDLAVSTEVIEHLYRPAALVDFARAKLRDRGYFIVTAPYHGWLKNVLIAGSGRWDSHHQARHDGGHIKFWSRDTLAALLEHHGFEVLEFHGVGRVRWLWKSMILVCRKCPA